LIPPPDILANEISKNLDELRREQAAELVKEKLKQMGFDLDALEEAVLIDVPEPDSDGHMEELKEFMEDCPPVHWKTEASDIAEELVDEQDEEMETSAEKRIKETLEAVLKKITSDEPINKNKNNGNSNNDADEGKDGTSDQ
jgi:hypothetical protein